MGPIHLQTHPTSCGFPPTPSLAGALARDAQNLAASEHSRVLGPGTHGSRVDSRPERILGKPGSDGAPTTLKETRCILGFLVHGGRARGQSPRS